MAKEIIESYMGLNHLMNNCPEVIANVFKKFSAEARKNKTALTQEQLEQCAASLERTFS